MPKPVLSDSLFNADDVATAVLDEANLQVSNSFFAVTTVTDLFTLSSPYTIDNEVFYVFNKFAFVCMSFDSSSVSNGDIMGSINSDYLPVVDVVFPVTGYQGDTANYIKVKTNGDIQLSHPDNTGGSHFYGSINGWYRVE